ncbi:MAG: D-alanyl-D-alanine carboxypeptidase [Bacteroidetes bacterium]|nr:MAG: D-alanyl-D-alanine carboxypeptidase [Bacteroidota bacterium]
MKSALIFCVELAITLTFLAQSPDYTKADLLGQISPASNSSFTLVPEEYTSRSGIYLRIEVYEAFDKLRKAALDEGIEIIIVSGTRTFSHQKSIWERKWERPRYMGWSEFDKALDILSYSSMPGTSRHHWGTDLDINSLENSYFESGEGLKVYNFLIRHAVEFGFQQVYTSVEINENCDESSQRTGYNEEKWHWSYLPTSIPMLKAYNKLITTQDLTNFKGANETDSLKIIENFVNGVHIQD